SPHALLKPETTRERRTRIKVLSSVSGRVLSRVFEGTGPPEFDPKNSFEGVESEKHTQVSDVTTFGEGGVGASTTNTFCERLHILSTKGTVRGVQHKVSTAQVHFSGLAGLDAFSIELGKIVVYTTSLRVVRATHERCEKVRHVFHTHSVRFEERDVALNGGYGSELIQSSNTTDDSPSPELPAVFINGIYFGVTVSHDVRFPSAELNVSLSSRPYTNRKQKESVTMTCKACGGFRFVPCRMCHGCKVSPHHCGYFANLGPALRCSACNENGLQLCDHCEA
uniref:Glutaredoxin domain-containing protein n=1 Tax=Eptatretus burgeri TaxID=7764 RepID=A0A8C4QSA8_EPTBU